MSQRQSMTSVLTSEELDDLERPQVTPASDVERSDSIVATSRGAAQHGTGECKPCAWFWKPQGCEHGEDCGFCHRCPREEIKTRRKVKAAKIRGKASQDAAVDIAAETQHPLLVHSQAQAPAVLAPPLSFLPPLVSLPLPSPALLHPAPLPVSLPPASAPPSHLLPPTLPPLPASDASSLPLIANLTQSHSAPASPRGLDLPAHVPPPPPSSPAAFSVAGEITNTAATVPPGLSHLLPSVGSVHHGTGRCKPCGWFWKAGGCVNGRECCHCHLCPQGEIRARRKVKLALIQHRMLGSTMPEEPGNDEEECASQVKNDLDNVTASHQEPRLPKLLGRGNGLPLTKQSKRPTGADQILAEMWGAGGILATA